MLCKAEVSTEARRVRGWRDKVDIIHPAIADVLCAAVVCRVVFIKTFFSKK
jgi:hypothetical protein